MLLYCVWYEFDTLKQNGLKVNWFRFRISKTFQYIRLLGRRFVFKRRAFDVIRAIKSHTYKFFNLF